VAAGAGGAEAPVRREPSEARPEDTVSPTTRRRSREFRVGVAGGSAIVRGSGCEPGSAAAAPAASSCEDVLDGAASRLGLGVSSDGEG
jgi:hypothetical protein